MRRILGAVCAVTVAMPAWAQEPAAAPKPISEIVKSAQPTTYEAPACDLGESHFKVSSGRTYVKAAIENATNRERILGDAKRVLMEAVEKDGQSNSGQAWFWLGRVALYQGDIAAADAAMDRAESLAPGCREEIAKFRRPTWAGLTQAGIDLMNQERNAEAKPYLEAAASFYDQEPQAFAGLGSLALAANDPAGALEWYRKAFAASGKPEQKHARAVAAAQIGTAFAGQGNTDSAIAYLGIAVQDADTVEQAGLLKQSLFNLALMEQRAGRPAEAARHLGRVVQLDPADVDAKRGLAQALRSAGMADSARTVEQGLLQAAGTGGAVSAAAVMDLGVAAYREQKYKEAAEAFAKVLAMEPNNRDALYNLANSYLGLNDWARLSETADRLLLIEPYNEFVNKASIRAHQQQKHAAAANAGATKLLAMPVAIEVTAFSVTGDNAAWQATATGRDAMTASGAPMAPAASTIVVEFLDHKGGVVASQEVAVNALPTGQSQSLSASGTGAGIQAWRYRPKS
ncbi:MAG TPA: tetratricopeptide repeat protein [Gemmatimonadales bacterium]|nr:tetratricopeptide repeat protein [Gemmatimonadales bacterium]